MNDLTYMTRTKIAAILALEAYEQACDENESMWDAMADHTPEGVPQLRLNAKEALRLIQIDPVAEARNAYVTEYTDNASS